MKLINSFKKGEIVFHEGNSSCSAYIVGSGPVEIIHKAVSGEKILGI